MNKIALTCLCTFIINGLIYGQGENNDYRTEYKYDANGNIISLLRYDKNGVLIDNLVYNYQNTANGYKTNTNKLSSVTDLVNNDGTIYKTDIKNQNQNNYKYDELGNVISDLQEEIELIDWNWKGKISKIIRFSYSLQPNIEFKYDAFGNMISRTIIKKNGDIESTIFIRDPFGNVMSSYVQNGVDTKLKEQYIYSQKRIGTISENNKSYEISDHLGNVRTVITTDNEVVAAYDYYPFGMEANSYVKVPYRYGFGGKEKIDEINNGNFIDFGERGYDPRIARWWSVDPWYPKYPSISPYAFVQNSPILYKEVDGRGYTISIDHEAKTITIIFRVYVPDTNGDNSNLVSRVNEAKTILESSNFQFKPNGSTETYDIKFSIVVEPVNGHNVEKTVRDKAAANPVDNSIVGDAEHRTANGDGVRLTKKQMGTNKDRKDMTVRHSTNDQSISGTEARSTIIHEILHGLTEMGHVENTVFATSTEALVPVLPAEIIQNILQGAGSNQKFQIGDGCGTTPVGFSLNSGTVSGSLVIDPSFDKFKQEAAKKQADFEQNKKDTYKRNSDARKPKEKKSKIPVTK